MSHYLCMTGSVSKVISKKECGNGGAEIVMHVISSEKMGHLWFTVKAQGRVAEAIFDEVMTGDKLTVFGKIWPQDNPVLGNIYVYASNVELHGLSFEEEIA